MLNTILSLVILLCVFLGFVLAAFTLPYQEKNVKFNYWSQIALTAIILICCAFLWYKSTY